MILGKIVSVNDICCRRQMVIDRDENGKEIIVCYKCGKRIERE